MGTGEIKVDNPENVFFQMLITEQHTKQEQLRKLKINFKRHTKLNCQYSAFPITQFMSLQLNQLLHPDFSL